MIEDDIQALNRRVDRLRRRKVNLALTAATRKPLSEFLSEADTDLFEHLIGFLESESVSILLSIGNGASLEIQTAKLLLKIRSKINRTQLSVLNRVRSETGMLEQDYLTFKARDAEAARVAASSIVSNLNENINNTLRRKDNSQRVDHIVKTETVRSGIDIAGNGGVGVGENTRGRLADGGIRPVAYRWVLGEPEYPHPDHEILGGSVVTSLNEWDTRPGAWRGCRCRIELLYEQDLID